MKVISNIFFAGTTIIGGQLLAWALFSPLSAEDPIAIPCMLIVACILVTIKDFLQTRCASASLARIDEYIRRRDKKFKEIEERTFVINYELMRADFLEGRDSK